MAGLRERLAGTEVAATEPIFGYLFEALGLRVRNQSFQLAVMRNTEPSISDIVAFEDDLKSRRIKLLLYNSQAASPIADRCAAWPSYRGSRSSEPPRPNPLTRPIKPGSWLR